MKFTKIIGTMVSFCMLSLCLSSCGEDPSALVYAGSYSIKPAQYKLYEYIAFLEYARHEGGKLPENKDEFLNKKTTDGSKKSISESLKEAVLKECKTDIALKKMFDDRKLSFTEEDKKKFEDGAEDVWKKSEKLFQKLDVDKDGLKEFLLTNQKREKVFESYYLENGEKEIKKEEWAKLYKDRYINFTCLLRSLSKLPDKESKEKVDPKKLELTGEEIKKIKSDFESYAQKIDKKEKTIEDIYKEVASDEKSKQLYSFIPDKGEREILDVNVPEALFEFIKNSEPNKAIVHTDDTSKIISVFVKKEIEDIDGKFADKNKRAEIAYFAKEDEFLGIIEENKNKLDFSEKGPEIEKVGPGYIFDKFNEIQKEAEASEKEEKKSTDNAAPEAEEAKKEESEAGEEKKAQDKKTE